MLLLFAGGVMNVVVIIVLTVFVTLEKLLPLGRFAAPISGALMIAAGCWLLVR
jgi:predicted metal-binding membrane protein